MKSPTEMADEEITTETGTDPSQITPEQGPLVAVTFQKNPHHKLKYLESEPKALGVTEIALSVFHISSAAIMQANGLSYGVQNMVKIIVCFLVVIAGILAIAAQNLHLPTLKACLGMQVVACAVSIFNMISSSINLADGYIGSVCWRFRYVDGNSTVAVDNCRSLTEASQHYFSECVLVHSALIAISATLAVYCCKVVNCCSPTPRMPVITVQAPPAQH